MQLTPSQQKALDTVIAFLSSEKKTMLIHGMAGTGKSAILHEIFKYLNGKCDVATPTHAAANVLKEKGIAKAGTIHNIFGLIPRTNIKGEVSYKLPAVPVDMHPVVLLDEASMINSETLQLIFAYQKRFPRIKFIFLGDMYQLAPVGESDIPVLKYIDEECELTEFVRNADPMVQSLLVHLRDCVKKNISPKFQAAGNVRIIKQDSLKSEINTKHQLEVYSPSQDIILAFRNNTVTSWINAIQEITNKPKKLEEGDVLTFNEYTPIFFNGIQVHSFSNNSVVQIRNVLDISEDVQKVTVYGYDLFVYKNYNQYRKTKKQEKESKTPTEINGCIGSAADLRRTGAFTIYKSQGITCRNVYVLLNDLKVMSRAISQQDYLRALYVAASRASGQVIFVI